MLFSMIFEAQMTDPTRANEARVIRGCVDQAVLAEQAGFDRIWAVEHHALLRYAHMSAPEVFLAHVAGRTERIRLGHGVVCVPYGFNHPIRVAERVAMLDVLSGGRVDFGVGRGATDQELGAFGVDRDVTQPQLEATLRMVPRMWREEVFEHADEWISIPPRPIIPKPLQDPHPPLFAACTKEATLNMAGELGVGALALGFDGPDGIAAKNKVYREAVARRRPEDVVGEVAVDHLSALCPTVVLDDAAEARRIGFRGQRFFMESLNHWSRGGPPPTLDDDDAEAALARHGEVLSARFGSEVIEMDLTGTERRDAEQSAGLHLTSTDQSYGSPADLIAYVERLAEAGADEVMFLIQMGTVPQEVCMATIDNIGRHVLPHFRRA